jgi:hypothetical protein
MGKDKSMADGKEDELGGQHTNMSAREKSNTGIIQQSPQKITEQRKGHRSTWRQELQPNIGTQEHGRFWRHQSWTG